MEVIPKEVAFAAAKLDAFNRNRYRIETTGATTAGPSSIVTINLPDAAVLDLRTFRVHMDVLTTAAAGATGQVRAKCPHAADLIATSEVLRRPQGCGLRSDQRWPADAARAQVKC